MDIEDSYTSYCFDEACFYIINEIENNNQPIFKKDLKKTKSFGDLYARYSN